MSARLSIDEAVAMMTSMGDLAREDSATAERDGDEKAAEYWEGFADGLWALSRHIATGVKVTCFPVGSCSCHPFTLERRNHPFWQTWRAWYARMVSGG